MPRSSREAQILDLASREFAKLGYARTSLSAVAADAGISKPMIYSYFGSKEGLYAACLENAGAIIAREVQRHAEGPHVGVDQALETLIGLFAALEGRLHLWQLFFDPHAPRTGPVAQRTKAHAQHIHAMARHGVVGLLDQSGTFSDDDASALTAVWIGTVGSLMNWWITHPEHSASDMAARCERLMGALAHGRSA